MAPPEIKGASSPRRVHPLHACIHHCSSISPCRACTCPYSRDSHRCGCWSDLGVAGGSHCHCGGGRCVSRTTSQKIQVRIIFLVYMCVCSVRRQSDSYKTDYYDVMNHNCAFNIQLLVSFFQYRAKRMGTQLATLF